MAGVGRFRVESRWFSMSIRGSESNIMDKPVDVADNTSETDDIPNASIHNLDYTIPNMGCCINPELLPYIWCNTNGGVEQMLKDVGGD